MNLEELIKLVKRVSKELAEEEELNPLLFTLRDGKLSLAPLPLTEASKDNFKPTLTKTLRVFGVDSYIIVNEAWQASLTPNSQYTPLLEQGKLKVSEIPLDDKEEIICLTAVENGKSFTLYSAKIRTYPDKRIIDDWKESLSTEITGRLVLKEW